MDRVYNLEGPGLQPFECAFGSQRFAEIRLHHGTYTGKFARKDLYKAFVFSPKRPINPHACETWSELPSNISIMVAMVNTI